MTLKLIGEGKKAPAFSLRDQEDEKVALSSIEATFTVIFFYPRDNTSGCTIEAKGFEALKKKFQKLDAVIVGISGGDLRSKQNFCEKQGLSMLLLADADGSVGSKYGVFGKKKFMGRTFDGFHRVTYVLDESKKVLKVYDKVKPAEHPAEVLSYLKSLT